MVSSVCGVQHLLKGTWKSLEAGRQQGQVVNNQGAWALLPAQSAWPVQWALPHKPVFLFQKPSPLAGPWLAGLRVTEPFTGCSLAALPPVQAR